MNSDSGATHPYSVKFNNSDEFNLRRTSKTFSYIRATAPEGDVTTLTYGLSALAFPDAGDWQDTITVSVSAR